MGGPIRKDFEDSTIQRLMELFFSDAGCVNYDWDEVERNLKKLIVIWLETAASEIVGWATPGLRFGLRHANAMGDNDDAEEEYLLGMPPVVEEMLSELGWAKGYPRDVCGQPSRLLLGLEE